MIFMWRRLELIDDLSNDKVSDFYTHESYNAAGLIKHWNSNESYLQSSLGCGSLSNGSSGMMKNISLSRHEWTPV